MNRKLRFSRWRRLPPTYRSGQRRPPAPDSELQRISLYLPAAVIERAESLAADAGAENVQAFCEDLLGRAIEEAEARRKLERFEAEHGPLRGLAAIADDTDYLAEWRPRLRPEGITVVTPRVEPAPDALPAPDESPADPPAEDIAAIVIRHAAFADEPPPALLASLRRGETIDPDAARELIQALVDLEGQLQDRAAIDRRLAFALHRLAFESQVLITDGFPALGGDSATVETLRLVQEGVDRVLSGDDIRYATRDDGDRAEGRDGRESPW